MAEVRETRLPGVGVRHEFTTTNGAKVGVLVHRDGRRELLVYDRADPDACSSMLVLSAEDTRVMAELLGASQVTEVVTAMRRDIEGLSIEWIDLGTDSPMIGSTIGDGEFRTRTGCSIVAVVRGDDTVPAPGPDFRFESRDVLVAVGTTDGLEQVRRLVQSGS